MLETPNKFGVSMDNLIQKKKKKTKQKRMIKMRRGHRTLENMVETASNRGTSKRGNWEVTCWRKETGNRVDLGYKNVGEIREIYRVYHWGTLVLEIERIGHLNLRWKQNVLQVYGESVSDARGINAILDYFGIGGKRYTYKPVNGGFQHVFYGW